MRDVAVVSFAQPPTCGASAGCNEVEMLMPVVARGDASAPASPKARSASPCSGSCDYLAGAAVLVRDGARRASAPGRRSRSRTSRWTAPGRSTRRGCACSTATSTRRSSTPSASRRSATCRDVLTLQLDPVLPGAALARRGQPRGAAGARAARRRALHASATWPRSRRAAGATPSATRRAAHGRLRRRDAARRAVPRVAAAQARLPADLRRRGGDRARRRRRGAPACARGRRGSAASIIASSRTRSARATSRARRRRALAGEKAGAVGHGRVDVAELHAPFTHQELILRDALGLGDDVAHQPVGRRARGEPDDGRRPAPASARPRSAILDGEAAPRRSRTRPRARACSRTWSACWRAS